MPSALRNIFLVLPLVSGVRIPSFEQYPRMEKNSHAIIMSSCRRYSRKLDFGPVLTKLMSKYDAKDADRARISSVVLLLR